MKTQQPKLTVGQQLIQKQKGQPFWKYVQDLYAQRLDADQIAETLGVPSSTLRGWCRTQGMQHLALSRRTLDVQDRLLKAGADYVKGQSFGYRGFFGTRPEFYKAFGLEHNKARNLFNGGATLIEIIRDAQQTDVPPPAAPKSPALKIIPNCATAKAVDNWYEHVNTHPGARDAATAALGFCADCTPEFQASALAAGKCNFSHRVGFKGGEAVLAPRQTIEECIRMIDEKMESKAHG